MTPVYTETNIILADGRTVLVATDTSAFDNSFQALAYLRIMQRAWRTVREMEQAS